MEYVNKNTIVIDGVYFDIKENISSVSTDVHTSTKNYTFHNESLNETNLNIYFILETPHQAAFGHWVFESAIFLPYFKSFKNAKLLVNKNPNKKYKRLFFELLNINNDDIIYLDNDYQEIMEYKNIPQNNICIIPRHTCICHTLKDDTEDRMIIYTNLLYNFKKTIIDSDYKYNKEIDHLLLPRNTVENYAPNDCTIDYSNIYKMLENKNYITYNTIDTNDFKYQIDLISKTKNIYLEFGSAFTVNGFFAKDSNIYIINKNKYNAQTNNYPFLKCKIDFIKKDNNVILL